MFKVTGRMADSYKDKSMEEKIQSLIDQKEFDEAYGIACEAYQEALKAHCIRRLSGYRNELGADTEDVAQEVFRAFKSSLPKYDPLQGTVRQYLLGLPITALKIESGL